MLLLAGASAQWPQNTLSSSASGDRSWLKGVDSPPLGEPRDATVVEQAELPQVSSKVFVRRACAASRSAASVRDPACSHSLDGADALAPQHVGHDAPAFNDLPSAYRSWASSQSLPPFWTKLMPPSGSAGGRASAFNPTLVHAQLSSTTSELSRCRLAAAGGGSAHGVVKFGTATATLWIQQSEVARGVVILLPRRSDFAVETNIFHTLAMKGELWCLLQAALQAEAMEWQDEGQVTLVMGKAATKLAWARSLLAAVIGGSVRTVNEVVAEGGGGSGGGRGIMLHRNLTVRRVYTLVDIPAAPLWEVKAFEDHRVANPLIGQLATRVLHVLHVAPRPPHGGGVLLLSRKAPADRLLVDRASGTPEGLHHALTRVLEPQCVPFEATAFSESTPFRTQVSALAGAAVVVSAIGSQLTNLAWMRRGSVVVEVTMRWGWCSAPGYRFPPRLPCAPYYKADFATQARAFGHRYIYYDPAAISLRANDSNPISAARVFIEPANLASVLCAAYEHSTQRHGLHSCPCAGA